MSVSTVLSKMSRILSQSGSDLSEVVKALNKRCQECIAVSHTDHDHYWFTRDCPIDMTIPVVLHGAVRQLMVSFVVPADFVTDLGTVGVKWDMEYALAFVVHDVLFCWSDDTIVCGPKGLWGHSRKRIADAALRSILYLLGFGKCRSTLVEAAVHLFSHSAWKVQEWDTKNRQLFSPEGRPRVGFIPRHERGNRRRTPGVSTPGVPRGWVVRHVA
ncbi:hypothetical protein KIPB_002132 [Kipferlia bialata]|uniref:Uncharacterized protein n=1 Tax=Kipferlia bialata TaxID=797122 RepID=A0A9K3GEQ2_9EUKA|nr:hypothetical protein KIPB_002132 [Kipferlia bialata]|eukprot:g2132.t1